MSLPESLIVMFKQGETLYFREKIDSNTAGDLAAVVFARVPLNGLDRTSSNPCGWP
ncbi:MAG: hypothetical protein WBG92_19245 [Thiohalocapsa sp.]